MPVLDSKQNPRSLISDADEIYLIEVVTESRVKLESALSTAQRYSQIPALVTALADAVTGCQEAAAILDNLETYADGGKP